MLDSSIDCCHCRLEWRPSRWHAAAVALIWLLSAFAVLATRGAQGLSWEVASLWIGVAAGMGLRHAVRVWHRPSGVLELLPAKAKVNIVGFGTKATAWSDKLQPLDKRRKKAAADFVQALTIQGATNVHDGVKLAFQDEEVDTVFLLTDGYPSAGEIVAPGRLAAAIATWNVGRGIRIHTVAIGGASNFLERLAKESGGEHAVSR